MLLAFLLAAALSSDPHSLSAPDKARPKHLALDLTVDFAKKVLRGRAELTLEYAKTGRAPEYLDLDTRDLTISKVTDDKDRPLTFKLDPAVPILGQRLRVKLTSRLAKVRITYETAPTASALQWVEPAQTAGKKQPFLYTQSQAHHARSWIPIADSPGVRFTYEAVVHVPPALRAVMSAARVGEDPAQGVYRFKMERPIPAYLLALGVGDLAFKAVSERTGVFADPSLVESAASELRDMEKMMAAAEGLYGPYRWGRWDVLVLPPSFPYGGMENPMLTFATPSFISGDRSLVTLLAHELAHSWSGNLVTSATWNDIWLNEGFTRYFEGRVMEVLAGADFARMQELLGMRTLRKGVADLEEKGHPDDTRLALDLAGRDPDDASSVVVYEKGAAFLRMLEARFGREKLDAFLRRYFDAYAFKSMDTAGFLAVLRKDLFGGDDALWREAKIDAWVYGRGLPENAIMPTSPRFDRARAAAEAFTKTGVADGVREDWTTQEWVAFLSSLPDAMTPDQMETLEGQFHFSKKNPDVQLRWLLRVVHSAWEPGYSVLEAYVLRYGRMRYVRPLFEAMHASPVTQEMGQRLYAKARPLYHPIARRELDPLYGVRP